VYEVGTEKFSQNVGNLTVHLRCVTSQKSEDLIYTAAEAWTYAHRKTDTEKSVIP